MSRESLTHGLQTGRHQMANEAFCEDVGAAGQGTSLVKLQLHMDAQNVSDSRPRHRCRTVVAPLNTGLGMFHHVRARTRNTSC